MHQQISVTQTKRKKILTRADLINELEDILVELRQRPEFASLRSYPLDRFVQSDNQILKCTTLGDLATNSAQALRDSSSVEKNEVAALVEAMYLLNIRSVHTVSMIRESFFRIGESASNVQKILQEVSAAIPNARSTQRVALSDANVSKLRRALGELRKSSNYSKVEKESIELFWDKRASSCSILSNMTWQQIIETPPSKVFELPNFGKSRLKHLLASIESAKKGLSLKTSDENANSSADSPFNVEQTQKVMQDGINEFKVRSTEVNKALVDVLTQSNSPAFLVALLSQSTIQRRVGQILGVTESRISQLLQQAYKDVLASFQKSDPVLLHKVEILLNSTACSERAFLQELELVDLSFSSMTLLRVVLVGLGAKKVRISGRQVPSHWSKSNLELSDIIKKLAPQLPLSSEALGKKIEQEVLHSNAAEIMSVLPPSLFFLKSINYWYRDQEHALFEILKEAKRPLSSQEITDIFETGPRQMRYLLQNSNNIVRVGRNNGRRYTIEA